jgi:hypothetical protein
MQRTGLVSITMAIALTAACDPNPPQSSSRVTPPQTRGSAVTPGYGAGGAPLVGGEALPRWSGPTPGATSGSGGDGVPVPSAGGSSSASDPAITTTTTQSSCSSSSACFLVTATHNLTQLFFDYTCTSRCTASITVDGTPIASSQIHPRGGPCNHGEDLLPRLGWIPLVGNQSSAIVCIDVAGAAASIGLGAKAAEECSYVAARFTNLCSDDSPQAF